MLQLASRIQVATLVTAALVTTVTLMVGCGQSQTSPDSPIDGAGEKIYTIGMSQCNLSEPWRVQMDADIRKAAEKHPNLKVIFKDAQNDSLRQCLQIKEFISNKVDLIIISPKEAFPLTKPVAEAIEVGIPVIVLDRALVGDQYTTFIGADNIKIGRAAGEWLVEKLGGKGKIVELKGLMTSTPGQDRHEGFRDALKDYPDMRILLEADMEWKESAAHSEMEAALNRLDDLDAVYAHNDSGAHGAYLAAKSVGREKDMLFVGTDALPQEGVAYVEQGILDATFQYPTGGAEAIDMALKIFADEDVPKRIVLGSRRFTKENVAQGGEAIE